MENISIPKGYNMYNPKITSYCMSVSNHLKSWINLSKLYNLFQDNYKYIVDYVL